MYIKNKIADFVTFVSVCIITILLSSCKPKQPIQNWSSNDISYVITEITNLMVHDITNPPLAARFYAYACLAGYEVISQQDKQYKSMHGILRDYPEIKTPEADGTFSYPLAALLAMLGTAKKMQPSGNLLSVYEDKLLDSLKKSGYSTQAINDAKRYALEISRQILSYAAKDGYNKISNYRRYVPSKETGRWYPTPPGYFDAVEPYFNTVRPFIIDSASQFKPEPPVTFNSNKNSEFYKITNAVYAEGKNLSQEHREVAAFWDCNPFAMQDEGHLMFGIKKISPGAHWMGITGIVCADANKDFNTSMKIFTTVAVGLMDAFMCCWDEKYRSDRIRPETAIRKYIDPAWQPLLQTPPFPEYLSGHSVISAASAAISTHYFGPNFSFTDSVEVSYNLPPRSFRSFQQASEEAAISRFYGGIHFMDAIDKGLEQGKKVAEKVVEKIK